MARTTWAMVPPSTAATKPVIGEALLHPIALGAVAVLLFNDHVLKVHYPGFVTGKLSDLAGLVFFPLLLWTLLDATGRPLKKQSGLTYRNLVLCIVVTGLVFVAIKTTSIGSEAFRRLWAVLQWPARAAAAHHLVPLGRVRLVEDATDLLALPMLLVAYSVGKGVIARTNDGEVSD